MTWQPIDTAPKDGTPITRWHRVFDVPVVVRHMPAYAKDGGHPDMPWVTGTHDHCWPEESFTPHWAPVIEGPNYPKYAAPKTETFDFEQPPAK